jgi:hypothetical protein
MYRTYFSRYHYEEGGHTCTGTVMGMKHDGVYVPLSERRGVPVTKQS